MAIVGIISVAQSSVTIVESGSSKVPMLYRVNAYLKKLMRVGVAAVRFFFKRGKLD